jgi:hypothetical protein
MPTHRKDEGVYATLDRFGVLQQGQGRILGAISYEKNIILPPGVDQGYLGTLVSVSLLFGL